MKKYIFPIICLCFFIAFTIGAKTIDVQQIGPLGSSVGFATINMAVRNFIQSNIPASFQNICYSLTKVAAILAILTACYFAMFGLTQLLKRKSLLKVDWEIIMLGLVYALTILLYVLFEKIAVNFRPILEDGNLEPSYPSTHTMIVFCILGSAKYAFHSYINKSKLRLCAEIICVVVVALTVIGRLISGVHWFSDIIGGVLISLSIVSFYKAQLSIHKGKQQEK